MRNLHFGMMAITAIGVTAPLGAQRATSGPQFAVSFPSSRSPAAQDGRLLLLISSDSSAEPRFQPADGPETQLVFGVNVDGLRPGQAAIVDGKAFGYPITHLRDVPAGHYRVQALLNRYRGDGHIVKLPPDRGEGQQWNRKPGNFYSTPRWITFDPKKHEAVRLVLDQEIPPLPEPPSTKYVRHERIRSELLSKFWGKDVYLGAHVLLPWGFDEHPDARYPLALSHGHFPDDIGGWREVPPDPALKPDYSARFDLKGYNRIQEEYAYQLFKEWTGPGFPRAIVVEIQHPTPYYDDSYAVNSENNGPYGDAIMKELIPYIEKKYRGIGAGYARITYGGSTGGWEAMAAQVLYPDEFNGAFIACPDPIDFRFYTNFNLYDESNAYFPASKWKQTPRPAHRNYLGQVQATIQETNYHELAIGTLGRSGGQWDIWQAVYSPVGDDGYPKPIYDKVTGAIDKSVADYWREHYDLSYILRRDWSALGPKVRGKLHIYVGDMDNYYLNDAVYLTEDFLKAAKDPPADAEVDYGDRAEHCWNGDHTRANAYSRLRYHQMFLPRIIDQMRKHHPVDADTLSWRY